MTLGWVYRSVASACVWLLVLFMTAISVQAQAAPEIVSIFPDSGRVTGGTFVTIRGTGFTGTTRVSFHGHPARDVIVVNDTTITVYTPANSALMTVDVHVTTGNGDAWLPDGFTYTMPPPLANPVSATVGYNSADNPITLVISGAPASSVAIDAEPVHGTAVVDGTSINYSPDADYLGSDAFTYTATNSAGTSAPATVAITVSAPAIAFTPAIPPAGTVGVSYSQSIAGASGGTAPYTYALASGNMAPGLTLASDGTLSGTPTTAGTYNFQVTATDRSTGAGPFSSTPADVSVVVNAAAPKIASVSPSRGPAYGGTIATITGSGLTDTTSVTFGGKAATSITVVNDSSITAWTPEHPEGTVDVVVMTPAGSATAGDAFTYWAPAVPELSIDDVSMNEGDSGRKSFLFRVRLSTPAPSAVRFDVATANGSAIAGSDYDPISLSGLTIPAGSSGYFIYVSVIGNTIVEPNRTFFVNVTNVDGATVVKSQGVGTILDDDDAPPTIASVTPDTGSTTGGTSVTITGTGFTSTTGVTFGGLDAASFRIHTPTRITAETAANAAGPVDVVVTTGGGTATLAGGFTFVAASPVITRHPSSSTIVAGENATFSVSATDAGSYRWQVLTGAGFTDIADGGVYSGASTPMLVITGAIQAMNGYMYRAVVTGPGGETRSNGATLTVIAPLALVPAEGTRLAKGRVGTAYSETSISATGGFGSIGYSATGLPDGLSIHPRSGAIDGTPTAPGIFYIIVTATAAYMGGPVSSNYLIEIEPAPPLELTPPDGQALTQGRIHDNYSYSLISASGGVGDIAFSATGLPAGLVIHPDEGVIYGKPTEHGTFTVTVTAKASAVGSASADYTLKITDMPAVASPVFTDVDYGSTANEIRLMISGGTPTLVAVADAPDHGTATAVGTTITYTPDAGYGGPDEFSYTATNEAGTSLPAIVSIYVLPPTLSMTPVSGTLTLDYGVAYSQPLSASGGAEPYAYALTAGTLPAGISLDAASGTLSGTPTRVGNFLVAITATDSSHGSSAPFSTSARYTLQVNPARIEITPANLKDGTTGIAYTETLSATGGIEPYSFSLSTGVPPGLSLRGATLSGTPTESGRFDFAVWVEDANGQAGARTYSLIVNTAAPVTLTPPGGALSDALIDASYTNASISASGGVGDITFTAAGLPAGLAMDPATGVITGTPTTLGSFSITVTATAAVSGSASGAYTLNVVGSPIAHDGSGTVPANSADNPITVDITGGAATALTITSQPANGVASTDGLTVTYSPNPGFSGTDSFQYTASNDHGSSIATITVTVTPAPIVLDPPSGSDLSQGQVGEIYSETGIGASGGTAPISFSATGLPDGLSMNAASSAITGIPTAGGTFSVSVEARDAASGSAAATYTLLIDPPALVLTPPSGTTLTTGQVGEAYNETIAASGGAGAITFAATGLPGGLSMDASSGEITGTPTAFGTFGVVVTATGASFGSASASYTLVIAAPAVVLTPTDGTSLAAGAVGSAYSETQISASGGAGVISYSATGLPAGLMIDSDTGAIIGTPSEAGSFMVAVTATAAVSGSASASYSISIAAPIVLAPADGTALTAGEVGAVYSQSFAASGGSGNYTFTLASGTLPAGLILTPDGHLSGTPTVMETAGFSINASDARVPGNSGTAAYSLEIKPAPLSSNAELASLQPGRGALEPSFNSSTLAYTLGVGHEVEAITMTPTAADTKASIRVDGQAVVSGTASQPIALAVGSSTVETIVTAEDGTTALTYSVTVTRAAPVRPDPSLDPEVIGLIGAQVGTATRFAQTQMSNFRSRLEQLHHEGDRRASSMNVRLGITQADPASAAEQDIDRLVADSHAAVMPGMPASGSDGAPMPGGARTRDEGAASPFAGPDLGPFAVWSGGFVNFGERESGGLDLGHTMVGVSGGIDYRFSEQFIGGVGIGYGRDRTEIGANGTESRASAFSAALYGSYKPKDNLFIDGLLGGGWMDFDSTRFITGNGGFATGNRSGKQIFGSLTAAYEFRDESWLISPYGTVAYSRSWLDGFTEVAGDIYGLTYGDQTIDTLAGVLGIRANYAFEMDWGVLTPGIRLEYTHDFAGSSRASIGYSDLGTLPYTLEDEGSSRDHLAIGIGLDAQIGDAWNLGFDYRTAFGTNAGSQDHTLAVRLGMQF